MRHLLTAAVSTILFIGSIFRIPVTHPGHGTVPLGPPKFKKLVYLLIDGLRFDGFVPVKKEGFYFNNFRFTRNPKILETTFLSVASIPTATTCRVIGLMTGAPSNQIEELLTFFLSDVKIESLPDKFSDRDMMFYGDEVWAKSFKTLKDRSHTFCGFSKDNLVENEMILMDKVMRNKNCEVRFIHTITLDALGHMYGINHPEIKEALLRADKLINDIYNDMDEDTLLVVTSDHGVTDFGAHGGTSEYELASVCGFYSKRENSLLNRHSGTQSTYNERFLKKFYEISQVNTCEDWIEATNSYRIVQQDDILPTISYFMGVGTPKNTYGNFIPYLVDDQSAEAILLEQKRELVAKSRLEAIKLQNPTEQEISEANYETGRIIYESAVGKYPILALASLMLAIAAFYQLRHKIRITKSMVPLLGSWIFAVVMVSHSYRAFVFEDTIWSIIFLFTNPSVCNLLFVLFILRSPGKNFFEKEKSKKIQDCLKMLLGSSKLECILGVFKGYPALIHRYELAMIMVLFFFFNRKNKKFIGNCIRVIPQLGYLAYSLFIDVNTQSKIGFLVCYPSFESLFAVHMAPTITIVFVYFIQGLQIKGTQITKHAMLSLAPFLVNIENVIQSIDYNVFFALSKRFGSFSCYSGAFTYFVVPRILIMRKFQIDSLGSFLGLFKLFFCFLCSWVMHGSLVFQYFFVDRLLFVVLFFIIDSVLESLVQARRAYLNVRKGNLK